ncbi:MAG: rhodanese-like domain-containing protein, partial [Actinomycetota bacterium]|nr:rhodanese-like domain-containing protein [Actinomycetota bacterium]
AELLAGGARFINVDTRDEFSAEHISGTVNVPMSSLLDATTGWLDDDNIVVTSISESRARSAQAVLARAGFTEARYLVGGHDGWNGLFVGTDAREWTNPARIYHFTTSNVKDLARLFGDVTSKDLAELRTSTEALEAEFAGDVEVEIIDVSTQLNTAANLVERYDVPLVRAEGQNYLLIPSWLLIDREGGVRYYDALPVDIALATIYGWSTAQVR